MKSYTAGLQLHSDKPEHIITVVAENSDDAWFEAANIYRRDYDFSNDDLTTMVLYNEREIS